MAERREENTSKSSSESCSYFLFTSYIAYHTQRLFLWETDIWLMASLRENDISTLTAKDLVILCAWNHCSLLRLMRHINHWGMHCTNNCSWLSLHNWSSMRYLSESYVLCILRFCALWVSKEGKKKIPKQCLCLRSEQRVLRQTPKFNNVHYLQLFYLESYNIVLCLPKY